MMLRRERARESEAQGCHGRVEKTVQEGVGESRVWGLKEPE